MNYTKKEYCKKCVKNKGDITKVSILPLEEVGEYGQKILRVCKLHGDINVYNTMSLNDIETHLRFEYERLTNVRDNLQAMLIENPLATSEESP